MFLFLFDHHHGHSDSVVDGSPVMGILQVLSGTAGTQLVITANNVLADCNQILLLCLSKPRDLDRSDYSLSEPLFQHSVAPTSSSQLSDKFHLQEVCVWGCLYLNILNYKMTKFTKKKKKECHPQLSLQVPSTLKSILLC